MPGHTETRQVAVMFSGRVAVVTGSAQGLGKVFSGVLLERGSKVCISDVNQSELEKTYKEFKSKYAENVISQQCDVTDSEQLKEVFRKTKDTYGQLDLVVNNAGIVNEKNWQQCIDVNLNGTIRGTMLGMEYMRKDKGGKGGLILNMSSLAGIFPVNYTPAYAASKHGVIGYTRSWSMHPDVVNNGVRLVCLCPAFVDTDMIKMDDDSKFVGTDLAQQVIEKFGIMSTDHIIPVFVNAIEDEENNGSVISITLKGANKIPLPMP